MRLTSPPAPLHARGAEIRTTKRCIDVVSRDRVLVGGEAHGVNAFEWKSLGPKKRSVNQTRGGPSYNGSEDGPVRLPPATKQIQRLAGLALGNGMVSLLYYGI
ncbi:uncharacterized protein CIMG_11266 [Coccidioides immitis RS]|uniref:Uncharacterized protein n=4 Tax=Coccidioides immitis TaxID=5501 RepID=A0A0D8JWY2_COCIM|nr:uncharacterized protein CIMG_11266 [Coccidioides immitis RS]KJF61609.1 hypothetical protein CIMG_11266 [Coccidioides immitis RS]KMP08415.1 hypothetical protein CIRG_08096 [Coccidioides immitis RMSCC 2394]KMU72331.1 hypothetical protein CISG_02979 [Coccidioides immitis RMSCC 3703]KMU87230.1 hypothetical protein CIHG_04674 [Coccidioides immitis H538.4]